MRVIRLSTAKLEREFSAFDFYKYDIIALIVDAFQFPVAHEWLKFLHCSLHEALRDISLSLTDPRLARKSLHTLDVFEM